MDMTTGSSDNDYDDEMMMEINILLNANQVQNMDSRLVMTTDSSDDEYDDEMMMEINILLNAENANQVQDDDLTILENDILNNYDVMAQDRLEEDLEWIQQNPEQIFTPHDSFGSRNNNGNDEENGETQWIAENLTEILNIIDFQSDLKFLQDNPDAFDDEF